jgi:hypothetical protein
MEDQDIWQNQINTTLKPTEIELKIVEEVRKSLLITLNVRDTYMIITALKKCEIERINNILILNGEESPDLSFSERLEILLDNLKDKGD